MSQIETDTLVKSSPHQKVAGTIRRWIQTGMLSASDAIPSERSLAQQLDVHRDTVRRALESLRRQEVIERCGPRNWIVSRQEDSGSEQRILSRSIVVLTPYVGDSYPGHVHAGWAEFVSQGAVAGVRRANRYAISINSNDFSVDEATYLAAQKPLGVVAADVTGQANTGHIARVFHEAGIPIVVYGGAPEFADYDRVVSDHEQGAYDLCRWMIQAGRRKIANFWSTPINTYWHQARYRGYERALREAGLQPLKAIESPTSIDPDADPQSCNRELFQASVRKMGGYLIEHLTGPEPLDALLVATDRDTYYVGAACRLFGKLPGQDMLLAGYDNYFEDCLEREFEPAGPSVTIDKLNELAGEQMVATLMDRLEGRLPEGPHTHLLAPRLIVNSASA